MPTPAQFFYFDFDTFRARPPLLLSASESVSKCSCIPDELGSYSESESEIHESTSIATEVWYPQEPLLMHCMIVQLKFSNMEV
ncbi:uncharacterized protein [Bemisia tabaci]|uniref:uncharacterized protein isoform X2 n=1 Tax=Bemisia tabaci TaxID=7038 RepID=UPI003B27FDEC